MFKKGYIAIFAILLAVSGIGFVPSHVPNQEIVIQFSQNSSGTDSEQAIEKVRVQLSNLGIEEVHIDKRADGSLKISYYSDIDVSSIQDIFSGQQEYLFKNTNGNTDNPIDEDVDTYHFTVSEIASDIKIDNGLKGHVLEEAQKSHRFYPPDFSFSAFANAITKEIKLTELSDLIYSQQTVTITVTTCLLPETRAGPMV